MHAPSYHFRDLNRHTSVLANHNLDKGGEGYFPGYFASYHQYDLQLTVRALFLG